jgi:hypothetical protein
VNISVAVQTEHGLMVPVVKVRVNPFLVFLFEKGGCILCMELAVCK